MGRYFHVSGVYLGGEKVGGAMVEDGIEVRDEEREKRRETERKIT